MITEPITRPNKPIKLYRFIIIYNYSFSSEKQKNIIYQKEKRITHQKRIWFDFHYLFVLS